MNQRLMNDSTYIDTYTTDVIVTTETDRTTPGTTVTATVTLGAKHKRAEVTARAELSQAEVSDVFAMFRRQNGDASASSSINGTAENASMSSAFSSACACQTYGGSTITETYTDEAAVQTVSAFDRTTTTTTKTRTDGVLTSTALVTIAANAGATASASESASASVIVGTAPTPASISPTGVVPATGSVTTSAAAVPTAPAFICPDDNNSTVSQMVNNERFDYLVLCDYDLTDPTFYGSLYYSSFGQCVAACSTNDYNFNSPVCQGVSYYNTPNVDGYNCFLRDSANNTVPAVGVDSALLQRIAVGISSSEPAGTSTESAPFSTETPTANPSDMSSSVSAMMGNSTTSISLVTPGPQMPISGMLVNAATTYYSTYISNGSTFSSGTAFSTYYSSGSVWYESYYTSYTEVYASATTEYAVSSQETAVAQTNNSASSVQSGADGGYSIITDSNSTDYYPGGYIVTEVVSNQTYAANGTELSSTAVTNYYSYATGSSGSANGSVSSLLAESSAGRITSTSVSSTQSVIINSYGTGAASGYAASGYVTGASPSVSATTIINSYGTAYSSGYIVSGAVGGTGGGASGYGSGVIASPTPSTSETVINNSAGTAYASDYVASGIISGASGSAPIAATSTIIIVNSAGTAYSSGYVASGIISGTAGSSGTVLSGVIPSSGSSSPSYSFGDQTVPRGQGSASSTLPGTAPLGTAPSVYGTSYASSTILSGVIPPSGSPSPSYSFSQPEAPRLGTISTTLSGTAPLGTAPASSVYGTSGASSTVLSGVIPPSGSPSPSYSFSQPEAPRSGTISSTLSGTAPPVYNSNNGGYSGLPSPAQSSILTASGNTTSAPIATGLSTTDYSYSGPADSRVPGTESSSLPANTSAPTPTAYMTYTPPVVTGPSPYPDVNITVPAPTGTSPPSYSYSGPAVSRVPGSGSSTVPSTAPIGTGTTSTSYPTPPVSSGSPIPSDNSTLPLPTGTSPLSYSFTDTAPPRVLGYPTGTAPVATGTSPVPYPPFPTESPTTCSNGTMDTTTMFVTTTVYGCYETCVWQAGGYGQPQTFGPAVVTTSTSTAV